MEHQNYHCPKCNHRNYRTQKISTAGGFWSRFFDIQYNKFTAVICERCGYTELFNTKGSTLENIFDLFGS